MFEIVDRYETLVKNIPKLINESKFKKEYIITSLNLTRSTFYNKLKNLNFSTEELRKLGEILFPEEAQTYALKKSLERGMKDVSERKTRPHNEIMAAFRKQYGQ